MSISRIDHSLGRGSASPCRAERKPVNVTGTVASQMITPLATTHGVDPNASAMRPAKAIASPTYPTRSAQTAILQDPFCCSSSRSSTPGIVRAPPFSERVTLVLRGGNCLGECSGMTPERHHELSATLWDMDARAEVERVDVYPRGRTAGSHQFQAYH